MTAARPLTRARRSGRDLRLAVFGACCTALGGACLLLAACTISAPRIEPPAAASAAPELPAAAPAPPVQAPEPESVPTVPALRSPWPQLRATFALQDCDYNAAQRLWAHRYAANPRAFAVSLHMAMPFLLLVVDELERHHVPGEFALLPYLESNYVAIAPNGDRAAGIWQLMPDTAVEAGMRVGPDYDGRLDVYASTRTAIDLLQQYHDEFGDWRLADMAFNAGHYKLRQQAGKHGADWTARELARIDVGSGTHDHLAKLLALACIVSDPARFHVRLPEPEVGDALARVDLPAPVDLRLAARLAGIEPAQLRRLNPALLRGSMPANGPFNLLVPADGRPALERTLAKLPQHAWRHWHEVILKQDEKIDLFAMMLELDPAALAAINGFAADAPLAPGTHLLLPGVDADTDLALADPVPLANPALEPPESLVVHAGDTLWDIAHRYGLHVDDLLQWNGLSRSAPLRLGQHLILAAPAKAAAR